MKRAMFAAVVLLLAGGAVAFLSCSSAPEHSGEVVVLDGSSLLPRGLATPTGIRESEFVNHFTVAGDEVVACGRAGGEDVIVGTRDLGLTWVKKLAIHGDLNAIWARSASDLYSVATIYSNTDRTWHAVLLHSDGSTWTQWLAPTSPAGIAVTGCAEETLALVGGSGPDKATLFRSTDHGATWSPVRVPVSGRPFALAERGRGDIVVVGTSFITHSRDGGATWQDSGVNYPLQAVAAAGDHVFAVGLQGTIVHSTEGDHWAVQHAGTDKDLYGVWASASCEAWACGYRGTFLHTVDAGKTWTSVPCSEYLTLQGVTVASGHAIAGGLRGASRTHPTYR